MAAPESLLQAEGLDDQLWEHVRPRLALALTALELQGVFAAVRISADDLPGTDEAWFGVQAADSVAAGGPNLGGRLTISCHPDVFCRRRPQGADMAPPRAIWDPIVASAPDQERPTEDFSPQRTDVFLHQQLLTVDDFRRGALQGADIPPHLAEAFAAAWSVGVAGRLGRRHLPGLPIAECRQRFSRLFSCGGILLPDHWQIFESLWDGGLAGQAATTGAVRLLPRL